MRLLVATAFILVVACAGPGAVTVDRSAEGVQFHFAHGGGRGIAMVGVDVFEWDDGVRGKTVCSLNLKPDVQARPATLARWVYGKAPANREYQMSTCTDLVPKRRYGVAGFLYDHRLVTTQFRVTADGSVIEDAK